jgi:ubiquinone/menaquinone biosynthesis C-methylase UbiE
MNYENMLTLKNRLGNYDAGSVLDIGVGRGEFLKFALCSFHSWKRAAGIDIDPESLQTANRELAGTSAVLLQGSALAMPFTCGYFNTITMSNALHHIEALQSLFSETSRVCSPNGLIIINEMLNENQARLQETYMLYHRFIAEVDNQLGHFHHEPFTEKELLGIVKSSGLNMTDFFIHEETTGDYLNHDEIKAMTDRMHRKVQRLRGSDFYYFYENKIGEISNRLEKSGVHRPRHITFMLRPA